MRTDGVGALPCFDVVPLSSRPRLREMNGGTERTGWRGCALSRSSSSGHQRRGVRLASARADGMEPRPLRRLPRAAILGGGFVLAREEDGTSKVTESRDPAASCHATRRLHSCRRRAFQAGGRRRTSRVRARAGGVSRQRSVRVRAALSPKGLRARVRFSHQRSARGRAPHSRTPIKLERLDGGIHGLLRWHAHVCPHCAIYGRHP